MERRELCDRSEELRSKLLSIASDLEQFMNSPRYDETYKLAWYPKLIPEHFDQVERLVDELSTTFDTLLRTE